MLAVVALTFLEYVAVSMSSSAVLTVKVPPIGVLILAASSANLGLSILSPVITILRDDFSASADRAQLVLSAFMLSVAISQLISGSLSDRFGRKKILLSGSVIFIIGGVGARLSTTIDMLIGFRILQGAGAAACMTMGRVIVNDVYQGTEAARKLSIVSSAQAIVPAIGFAFGGVVAEFIGWRGSIGIMAMGGAMPYAFDRMGIGPLEYGLFFASTSIGYILGNFINGLLVGWVGVARMAYLGSLLTALVPMLMLAGNLTGLLTPLLLSFLCFCFGVCNGLVIENAMICSMRAAGRNSGSGTGLLGAMQMLFGGVAGSVIIALGGADYFSVTATGLLIMSLCAVLSSFLAPNSR